MDQPKSGPDKPRRESPASAGGGGAERKADNKPKKDKKDKGKDGVVAATGGSKRSKKSKKETAKPRTRVVIRRLPPSMTEEMFREQISTDGVLPKHEEFYFVGPDWSLGVNASSRAYITFTDPADVFRFTESYDGYTFIDSKGAEYPAVVEYAPFQRLPKNRSRKKDSKCSTIESDVHFIAFKEALEAEEQEAQHGRGTQEFNFNLEPEEKIKTTPLLEYVAQRKQERQDERRRKQEEKRKVRDEERHGRKTQIAKSMPEAIKEEREVTAIMVRTVPSRLDPAQNASKGSAGGSDKKGAEGKGKDDRKKEKKKDRNRDRKEDENKAAPAATDKSDGDKNPPKKQDREKAGKKREKDKAKEQDARPHQQHPKGDRSEKHRKEPAASGKQNDQPSKSSSNYPPTGAAVKKEVKKYSERRKETRARAESRLDNKWSVDGGETDPTVPKIDIKKSMLTADVPPFVPKEKTITILRSPSSTASANPPSLPPTERSSSGAQNSSSARDVPSPISEETNTDNGKSPSPDTLVSGDRPKDDHIRQKLKEARVARKIRNKDRPSMEIYQPRKRIVAGKTEEERGGRSDSDRPSDTPLSAAASGDGPADRRHRLTKKAPSKDDRKNARRKNSSDAEGQPTTNEAPTVDAS
ncbi:regulator of nonsense transcripts 3A [Anopheles bellator]|uniref:regulator of nonsense transcripts 3A n=1 Tax=Anopheles bellator TaxID=139047 RepID=UPI002649326D|nr:regulator of nonsense transcripts 3A [Anopheles bellator]